MNQLVLLVYISSAVAMGVALATRAAVNDASIAFAPAVIALLLLCGAEVARHRRNDSMWLADPCVLVTIWVFGVYYGASNIVYFSADAGPVEFSNFAAMTDLTMFAFAACFVMWRGYGLSILGDISRWFRSLLPDFASSTKSAPQLIGWGCSALLALSIGARLVSIALGTYGYVQEAASTARWVDFAYVLRILGSFGTLVLAAVALMLFSRPRISSRLGLMLLVLVVVEVAFGFISGFKIAVVMPILTVAACYYVVRGKIPLSIMAVALGALLLAYLVVQPFRIMRYQEPGFDSYSVSYLFSGLIRSISYYQADSESFLLDTYEQILLRLNLTGIGAEGLAFSREMGLAEGDPDFLSGYLLSPLLAFVPRMVWPDKPEEVTASWYTRVVLAKPEDFDTSSGMGPLTYLYFGGGVLAILIGFFVLGSVYRLLRDTLVDTRIERLFIYISILPVLVLLEAGNLHAIIVTFLRLLPIFFIVRYLVFTRLPPHRVGI